MNSVYLSPHCHAGYLGPGLTSAAWHFPHTNMESESLFYLSQDQEQYESSLVRERKHISESVSKSKEYCCFIFLFLILFFLTTCRQLTTSSCGLSLWCYRSPSRAEEQCRAWWIKSTTVTLASNITGSFNPMRAALQAGQQTRKTSLSCSRDVLWDRGCSSQEETENPDMVT